MKPNSAEILFVVDRSGSMAPLVLDMVGGFWAFIEEQKKLPGECKVTLTQFDDEYEEVYVAKPLADVPRLVLQPRGSTALLEAISRTLTNAGQRFANMTEDQRPSRVLVVIITDGEENASSPEYTKDRIFSEIARQRDAYSWEFIFLGADQNAIHTAQSYGIAAANAAMFNAQTPGSAKAVMRSVSSSSAMYRSSAPGSKVSMNVQDAYDSALKDVAGEIDVDGTPDL